MLRPERMTRALIVGPRDALPPVIETLYSMKLLHIVDHAAEGGTLPIGRPLPHASQLAESLVKLRSVTAILDVKGPAKAEEKLELAGLREKILGLELNISEEDSARKKTEGLLGDLARRIQELEPFAALRLPLDLYQGYDSLTALVGRVTRDVPDLEQAFPQVEAFRAPGVVAVFVPKERADEVVSFLVRHGFAQVDVPKGSGDPAALLAAAQADEAKWTARLEESKTRLAKLRERYAGFVVAAEEALEVEVEKAEAPLRFAVSDHSFVIDGWVPESESKTLASRLSGAPVHVEVGGSPENEGNHEVAAPPVLLKNPRPVKPFELLIHLYSTPNYHELDPTLFLLVFFPLFFGFMIGDFGYGFAFLLIGFIAMRKLPKDSAFRELLLIITLGGFWATVFGLFVYGEALGIPFHAPAAHPEELDWSKLIGLDYPLEALIHKSLDLGDMMYLSILFAVFHLGASFLIGFVNEVSHNRRHALAKLGWLLCLFGLFTVLTRALSWTHTGEWVYRNALGWFPWDIFPELTSFLGIPIPYASFALILTAFLGLLESPVAPLEIGGLLANMISYGRLAAIGVGKAAIAASFNTLILEGLILDQGIGFMVLGFVLFFLAQMMVFLLGAISAGIQGLRLHYVESFTKFYKGNGIRFRPFGMRAVQEA